MNKKQYSNNHITEVLDSINQERLEVGNQLEELLLSHCTPTPLKTEQQQRAKCQEKVNLLFKTLEVDMKQNIECYLNHTLPHEKETLAHSIVKIFLSFQALFEKKEAVPFTDEDWAPFDVIATRTFSEDKFKEASCMWRLIIELSPMYSRAWVGWALAEQMSGHHDVVNQIYHLTKELFPYDAYIALFAADFYLCENKPHEARERIQNTIQKLKEVEGIAPETYEALNHKLAEIDLFK